MHAQKKMESTLRLFCKMRLHFLGKVNRSFMDNAPQLYMQVAGSMAFSLQTNSESRRNLTQQQERCSLVIQGGSTGRNH
jgi:hypothetical protein